MPEQANIQVIPAHSEQRVPMALSYRPGTIDDAYAAYGVMQRSIADFGERHGVARFTRLRDPAVIAERWQRGRPRWEHVARTAEHFWLAERDGRPVGEAQAILRDGTRVLSSFFVEPGEQSQGIGRELLSRAFPPEGARRRALLASYDVRAVARYLKAGVYPRFPLYTFSRPAAPVPAPTDLVSEPVTATPETLAALGELDRATVGYGRDADHAFLLAERQGYLYRRDGRLAGYGYLGDGEHNGPFALLDAGDFPAVLAHAEREAAARGAEFGVQVPLVNRVAVDYLLARGCRLDAFFLVAMSDVPFGHFDRYIFADAAFFI
jgi:GNAT superfamily N-acetyltransferase